MALRPRFTTPFSRARDLALQYVLRPFKVSNRARNSNGLVSCGCHRPAASEQLLIRPLQEYAKVKS